AAMSDKVVPIDSFAADIFGFSEYLQSLLDQELLNFIARHALSSKLADAVHYVLFPGGKRIRPLCLATLLVDCGGNVVSAVPAALSLELLHNASLIHDDLPALDNDELRRGRATCHKVFGEATAILAGDCMVSLANMALVDSTVSPALSLELSAWHSRAYFSLCDGQQLDLDGAASQEALLELHARKTGALFGASLASAALILQFSDEVVKQFAALGQDLGIYFQLVDDALDQFGSDSQRGRAGSSDSRNDKQTLFRNHSEYDAGEIVNGRRSSLYSAVGQLEKHVQRSFTLFRGVLDSLDRRLEDCLPQVLDKAI
ncbi:MAG: polyprenyl synthetase family protein, partial [Bdellovibrionales bacterium]|nr:polyprenyl synthetase family protein [Bdellovibrionales bacterium]